MRVHSPVSNEVGECAKQTVRGGQLCREAAAKRLVCGQRQEESFVPVGEGLQVHGDELRLTERSTEQEYATR